jgi:O-methyltransferase
VHYQAARAAGYMGVSVDRCYLLYQLVSQTLNVPGDLVECGVYKGGTAQIIASVVSQAKPPRTFHLFDSFEGMPTSAVPARDHHKPGDFANTSVGRVQERLRPFANMCHFHCGFMPDTFSELPGDARFAFAHIDVDIYPSVMDCCSFFWPKLSAGGCMVFDDYGFYTYRHAARSAVDAFFATKRERPIVLPTGQALVMKLPS